MDGTQHLEDYLLGFPLLYLMLHDFVEQFPALAQLQHHHVKVLFIVYLEQLGDIRMVERLHDGHFRQQALVLFLLQLILGYFLGCPVDLARLHQDLVHAPKAASPDFAYNLVVLGEAPPLHFYKLVPFHFDLLNRLLPRSRLFIDFLLRLQVFLVGGGL